MRGGTFLMTSWCVAPRRIEDVMADIKQAAKWMDEGKKVTRKGCSWAFHRGIEGEIAVSRNSTPIVFTEDLLAEDWKIASD